MYINSPIISLTNNDGCVRQSNQIFDYRKKLIFKMIYNNERAWQRSLCVFLLYNDEEGQSDALKIQAPIGSLAHEYSLLLRIEERVETDACGFYPFPRSRALTLFSEGGLFSMKAGSYPGMTLIGIVNTYADKWECTRADCLYCTSRMLKHIETLHQYGKVLHADAKPDNWVLSKDENHAGDNTVGSADLMLVNFGRSVDLEKVAPRGVNPLQAQFNGRVAAEDMECGSMREGRYWGIDLDFYGLAASAFILLFGSHMEATQGRSRKWRLPKSLRRYWQRELWNNLFYSLLNFDSSSDRYCLSDIRTSLDDYLQERDKEREIVPHLNQLYLPKKR